MSKPIDLKTVKIYEHLKTKPSLENKVFKTLNSEEIYENVDETIKDFVNKIIENTGVFD